MAWLQKRPSVVDSKLFYTIGLNKTVLLVGLGNIGPEYELTRHNVGFKCVDEFVQTTDEMNEWIVKKDLKSLVSTGQIAEVRVVAIKPTTFMNLSGEAVGLVSSFYKIQPSDIVVVHDDLDIEFGQIRSRLGGSSAGHNGVKSISGIIGQDYYRLRIGIGPKPANISSEKFVLSKFSPKEQPQLSNLTKETNSLINEYIFGNQLPNETRSYIV
jgi:PTH1 family peptidyl-tRNA hydrolase